MIDDGFVIVIVLIIAIACGVGGYSHGRTSIKADCDVLGKFSSGATVYECKKIKE
jgi:hypothetical protein